jgi:glycerol-3-phosphate dehydrogenase
LPGGEFAPAQFERRLQQALARWPFLEPHHVRRLFQAYGTRLEQVFGTAQSREDLGPFFGPELSAAEVRYLMSHEWAETADDVLWRRTKLGLTVDKTEQEALARFIANETGRPAAVGAE